MAKPNHDAIVRSFDIAHRHPHPRSRHSGDRDDRRRPRGCHQPHPRRAGLRQPRAHRGGGDRAVRAGYTRYAPGAGLASRPSGVACAPGETFGPGAAGMLRLSHAAPPGRSKRASGASGKLCRTDAKGLADKVPAGSQVEETNFDKVRRVRSFDDVVRQLREAIYSGRIRPGQRLPGERQLCEEFGVGRPTLREALRSLEAVGIIEVRPGKGGGSYAVTPSESTVGDALAALVNLRGASLEDLAEFRVDFEAENASWAARRADAGDIAMLRSIVAEARAAADDPATLREVAAIDVRWHEALARATKNRLRIGIALGIHEAVLRR